MPVAAVCSAWPGASWQTFWRSRRRSASAWSKHGSGSAVSERRCALHLRGQRTQLCDLVIGALPPIFWVSGPITAADVAVQHERHSSVPWLPLTCWVCGGACDVYTLRPGGACEAAARTVPHTHIHTCARADQLTFYGSYHANPWNQLIHFIFVPTILWTVLVWLAALGPISHSLDTSAAAEAMGMCVDHLRERTHSKVIDERYHI